MKSFSPDTRNIGGRYLISGIKKNHKQSLDLISMSSTRNVSVNKRKYKKSVNLDDYSFKSDIKKEFLSGYRQKSFRIGSVDSTAPETLNLSRVLSSNKKKRRMRLFNNHDHELKNLKRKIEEIGTVMHKQLNSRKKNPFDPVIRPVLIRNTVAIPKSFIKKVIKTPKKSSKSRNNSSYSYIPPIEDYLMNTIVNNTLFREKDLTQLFEYTRDKYSHLPTEDIDDAIIKIKSFLDS
jgi:hypothetical protein